MESSDGRRLLFLFVWDELQGHAISLQGLRVLLLFLIYIYLSENRPRGAAQGRYL